MNDSEFPRDFSHKSGGKECRGTYRELRRVTTFAYGSATEQVEKFVLELELDDGDEVVSYWLGSTGDKLVSLFRKELEARARLGKSDFEPGELIVIRQSDEMRPSKTSGNPMWDYAVEFEFAAPAPTVAELLGVTAAAPAPDGDPLEELTESPPEPGADDEPIIERQRAAAAARGKPGSAIPF